jgi:hypothetical protein
MSQEERTTWVSGVVTLLAAAWYGWTAFGGFGRVPVDQIAYQRPLIIAVVAMIVGNIVGAVVLTAGAAIRAEVTSSGSAKAIDRKDERDASIGARGDRAGFYVVSSLTVGVLALAMLEVPHFWIANGAFAALVLSGLVSAAVRLVAYRRGFWP